MFQKWYIYIYIWERTEWNVFLCRNGLTVATIIHFVLHEIPKELWWLLQITFSFKLSNCEKNRFMIPWIVNWMKGRTQSVIANGATSDWQLVTNGVPYSSILKSHLFSTLSVIWMQELNASLASLLMTLSWEVLVNPCNDEKLCSGICRLEHWAVNNCVKCKEAKCWVLHLGWRTVRHGHR